MSIDPHAQPDQVSWLLEGNADDVNRHRPRRARGRPRSALGLGAPRDRQGDRSAARRADPPTHHYEPNNDAGGHAYTLWGGQRQITATVDTWDNPVDVYSVHLEASQTIAVTLAGTAATNLEPWRPDDHHCRGARRPPLPKPGRPHEQPTALKQLGFRAREAGWHDLEVNAAAPDLDPAGYKLASARPPARRPRVAS